MPALQSLRYKVRITQNLSSLCVLLGFVGWTSAFTAQTCTKTCYHRPHERVQTRLVVLDSVSQRLSQIMHEGKTELYLPTYAWHNRYTYTSQRLKRFNEMPWGVGLGKSFYDEKGNWHGLYAMEFLDSHKKVEPVIGYAYLKVWPIQDNVRLGGGVTLLVTARADIHHYMPIPGALPWVSFNYRRVSLSGTYIPGHKNIGNVLFLVLKYVL